EPRGRSRQPSAEELRRLGPGKWTRSLLEERSEEDARLPGVDDVREAVAALARTDAATALRAQGAPLLRMVTPSTDGDVLGRASRVTALPADLAARLSPHVGARATSAARLHTDDAAAAIAEAHHARAVTLGADVFFGRGEFAPGTERGDELIAHELTHVAQGQRGELHRAAAKGITGGTNLDPSEAE